MPTALTSGMHHAMTRLSQQELSAFGQEIGRSHPCVRSGCASSTPAGERPTRNRSRRRVSDSRSPPTVNPATRRPVRPGPLHGLSFVEPLDPGLARFLGLDFYSGAVRVKRSISEVRSGEISAAPATPIGKGAFHQNVESPGLQGFFVPTTESERLAQVHACMDWWSTSRRSWPISVAAPPAPRHLEHGAAGHAVPPAGGSAAGLGRALSSRPTRISISPWTRHAFASVSTGRSTAARYAPRG